VKSGELRQGEEKVWDFVVQLVKAVAERGAGAMPP